MSDVMPLTFATPAEELADLVAMRRDLHRYPELRFRETRTAGIAAERLRGLGYAVTTGIAQTGVVGVLDGGTPGRTLLMRADMDALPIQEANDLPFASAVPGVMHACGHDAHVAVGLGTARRLAATQADLAGTVKYVFQPGEEGGCGALRMIEAGVLEAPRVDAAVGMHVWNDLAVGTISVTPGPVMASVDEFWITVRGRGGHAGRPHQATDPVVCAAHVITALQTIASRNASPFENLVVSITRLDGGSAFNIIPEEVELHGTVRTFGGAVFELAPKRIREVAEGVAAALGCTAVVKYDRQSPPLVNHEEMTTLVHEAAAQTVGAANVLTGMRSMGGEDFAFFLDRVPGCFAFVGVRNPAKGIDTPLHNPKFRLDEDALLIGVEFLERIARAYLR